MSEQLAKILQENKQSILVEWERSVRAKLIHARRETKSALQDSVPDFLDDLVVALKTSLNAVKPEILKFASKHGAERANTSEYNIEDALCEYNLLRKVIFSKLESVGPVSSDERDIILEAINYGMLKAGSEYAKRQIINLSEQRSMLSTIIEQMPAAIWIADASSGEITLSNSLGKEDLYFKAFHESGYILARSIVNDASCKNEIIKLKQIDRSDEFIRLDAAPIHNSLGEITHGVAIGTDVTELYTAQEELKVLFEMAGTGKMLINQRTGKILRVNKTFCNMVKYPANEILGKKMDDFMKNSPHEGQKIITRRDGSHFWGQIFQVTLPRNLLESEQTVCTVIDISDRKLIEEQMFALNQRLQIITDIQPNLIAQIDKDFCYEFVNNTFLQWYQVNLNDVLGKKIGYILGEDELKKIEPYLNEAMKGKRVVFEKEINYKPWPSRYLHITYSPNFDQNHQVDGLFISVSDHTEQRKALEAYQKLAKEEKQVADSLHIEQKMRDKFISALSHDLRTPLTTATIAAQMIERKSQDPHISSLAQRAAASLNRVAKMIEDLLDANSFQAGNKFIPELHHINVVELSQNTLNELETIYGERFILDSVDVIEAYLSPNGIRRVIENLCSNAIKYGSPTAPVTVGLYRQGNYLCLTVHNFGTPLKVEETQALFEQFVRSSSAEKSGKMGWGIGLSIVKGVVEAQGGSVDIEIDEDGTKFKIILPLDARSFVNHGGDESLSMSH